jgi:hypothetical protein
MQLHALSLQNPQPICPHNAYAMQVDHKVFINILLFESKRKPYSFSLIEQPVRPDAILKMPESSMKSEVQTVKLRYRKLVWHLQQS